MYIDEETERDNMILGMNPNKIKDDKILARYWYLRRMTELEEDDEE